MNAQNDLWRAYQAAWVEVELGDARFVFPPVARRNPPMVPSALRPHGHVITACNPRSEVLDEAENRQRMDTLARQIDRRRWKRFTAVGHDGVGRWREPSFAVVGAPLAEVLELARSFSQNAIYEWGERTWRIVAVPPTPTPAPENRGSEPMRLAVCSWSLSPSGPADLVKKVRNSGVTAVQLALGPLRDGWEVEETRRELADAGIAMVSGMMATRGEDYSTLAAIRETGGLRPDEHWDTNRLGAEECARIARELSLPLVTFHAGFIPHESDDPLRARMIERLREVVDIFAAAGVRIAFETGQETAATLTAALRELDRPDVGVNFDPANMILYGMGEPIDAVRALAPRIAQVHIKDALPATKAGEWGTEVVAGGGAVDWRRFLGIISALDPQVDLVIEREAGEDRLIDVRTAVALVRQTLAELGQKVPS